MGAGRPRGEEGPMEVPGPGGGESGGGKGLVLGEDLVNLESGVFLTRAMEGILPQPGLRHLHPRGPGARWEGLGGREELTSPASWLEGGPLRPGLRA